MSSANGILVTNSNSAAESCTRFPLLLEHSLVSLYMPLRKSMALAALLVGVGKYYTTRDHSRKSFNRGAGYDCTMIPSRRSLKGEIL
jgi:hypothetical protein